MSEALTPRTPSLREEVLTLKRALIEEALAAAHGNQSQAAVYLGVSESYIRRMMRQFALASINRVGRPSKEAT